MDQMPPELVEYFKENLEESCRELIKLMLNENVNLLGFQAGVEEDGEIKAMPVTIVFGIGNESHLLARLVHSHAEMVTKNRNERDSYLN